MPCAVVVLWLVVRVKLHSHYARQRALPRVTARCRSIRTQRNQCEHSYRIDVRRRAAPCVQNAEIESGSNSAAYCVRLNAVAGRNHAEPPSRGTLHIHNLNVPCPAEVNLVFVLWPYSVCSMNTICF